MEPKEKKMKNRIGTSVLALVSVLAMSALSVPAANAAGLLGGLVGGVLGGVTGGSSSGGTTGGLIGGAGSNSVVTLTSGPASNSGLVNVGLGGGSNNLASVNVGGTSTGNSLATVGVTSGGSSGLLDANVGVGGGLLDANVGVGGTGGLIDIGVGVGGNGGLGGPGDPGGPGNPGGPGGPGGNGNNGGNGGGFYYWASGGDATGSGLVICNGVAPRAISQLLQNQNYSASALNSWRRAANVRIMPIRLCPVVRHNVSRAVAMNGNVGMVQSYAAADPLISASLSRARYGADHVLAVEQSQGMLTVFVY
jgi:hypothetical protein